MPAPMPIQIRYGPSGLLAQAAAASGGYAGQVEASRYNQMRYQQQQQQDQSFLAQMQNQQMQREQMANQQEMQQQQLELEAQKLQMAQRGATPTSNAAYDSSSPLAHSIMNMKNGYLNSAMSEGVTGDAQKMLEMAAKDPNVTVDAFQRLSQEQGNVARKGTELAGKEANQKAAIADKQAIFDSLASQLPAGYADAFEAMVQDGSVSSAQLRMGIAEKLQQMGQVDQANRGRQIGGIDDQIDAIERQMKEMRVGGVDPNQAPAELSGKFRQPGGALENTAQNFWRDVTGGLYTPSYIENPPDITGIKKLQVYQQKLNELTNLQKSRDALANPQAAQEAQDAGVQSDADADAAAFATLPRPQSVAEVANLPSRTLFIDPNGTVRRKP